MGAAVLQNHNWRSGGAVRADDRTPPTQEEYTCGHPRGWRSRRSWRSHCSRPSSCARSARGRHRCHRPVWGGREGGKGSEGARSARSGRRDTRERVVAQSAAASHLVKVVARDFDGLRTVHKHRRAAVDSPVAAARYLVAARHEKRKNSTHGDSGCRVGRGRGRGLPPPPLRHSGCQGMRDLVEREERARSCAPAAPHT